MSVPVLPSRLAAFQKEILAGDPNNQIIPYHAERWLRSFSNDADLAQLLNRFPGSIGRKDLKLLSQEATEDQTRLRILFLATMIWGFGTVGYGPYRTQQMLSAPSVASVLASTAAHLQAGQLIKAYTGFQLPMCGPAFFTKFFYAIGLGLAGTPQPLVLDSRVAASLQLLASDEGLALTTYTKGGGTVTWYPQGYMRYVTAMHEWAAALGCQPDALEIFLFDPPAAFAAWHPGTPSNALLMTSYGDALRGYAYAVLKRDQFRCRYCGLDGQASFENWLHLSWDHLLPVGHPRRDDLDYIVAACRFCNEAYNCTVWDVDGKTPDELVAQKRGFVLAKRNEYRQFWEQKVK